MVMNPFKLVVHYTCEISEAYHNGYCYRLQYQSETHLLDPRNLAEIRVPLRNDVKFEFRSTKYFSISFLAFSICSKRIRCSFSWKCLAFRVRTSRP